MSVCVCVGGEAEVHACVCKGTLIFVSDFVTLLFI